MLKILTTASNSCPLVSQIYLLKSYFISEYRHRQGHNSILCMTKNTLIPSAKSQQLPFIFNLFMYFYTLQVKFLLTSFNSWIHFLSKLIFYDMIFQLFHWLFFIDYFYIQIFKFFFTHLFYLSIFLINTFLFDYSEYYSFTFLFGYLKIKIIQWIK